jgi:hypothetical protein
MCPEKERKNKERKSRTRDGVMRMKIALRECTKIAFIHICRGLQFFAEKTIKNM